VKLRYIRGEVTMDTRQGSSGAMEKIQREKQKERREDQREPSE